VAKRRTKEQIKSDRVIKTELLKLKEEILDLVTPMMRRDTGRLQDEVNGRVDPDTRLTMYQMYYGAFNYPAGKNSGEKNALLIAVNELQPKATKIMIKNITDLLLKDYK
jgi:hypothetical protein